LLRVVYCVEVVLNLKGRDDSKVGAVVQGAQVGEDIKVRRKILLYTIGVDEAPNKMFLN